MIQKQNSFSRVIANDAKMGAYYTNVNMAQRMGYLIDIPENAVVSVLEPSVGDASAVKAFLGGRDCKLFAVELNQKVAESVKEKGLADYLLIDDFLTGVKISHNAFGLCFSNPPYGEDEEGKRLETRFVEKIHPYLKTGAPLCLVVPYYVAINPSFLKSYFSRFQPVGLFKFDEQIYKQFQQVALIGIKRKEMGYLKPSLDSFLEQVELEKLPYLPEEETQVERKLVAVPSDDTRVEYFTTLVFDRQEAGRNIYRSALSNKLGVFLMPNFTATDIGRPPVPPKKDLLYMLAISGGGQGLVGSKENHDLHLQRGVAKVTKSTEVREESDGTMVEVEKSYTSISLNIIENDGTITSLT